ncbi:MAG: histidine kinase [Spirochaetales bacterium]|nr:histidine kinase [Spirochaetales bacterium]
MINHSFQKRLILVYSLLISGLILILSLAYVISIYSDRLERLNKDLEYRCIQMASQLDTVVSTMDFVSVDLVSLWEFMPAMATLHYYDRNLPENKNALMEAQHSVEKLLYRYSLIRDFHRVAVYNNQGDFFTNNFGPEPDKNFKKQWIESSSVLQECKQKNGKILITGPFPDHWNRDVQPAVFSVLRAVVGQQKGEVLGYIEVQNPYSLIESILSVPEGLHVSVTAVTDEGAVLFDKSMADEQEDDLIVRIKAPKSAVAITLRESRKDALTSLNRFITLFSAVLLLLLVVSVLVIRFFTLQMTGPLEKLTKHIEALDLGSLPRSVDLKSSHNEIEELNFAFAHLQKRLNESVQREIISHSLKIQANFDSLQAQVNPHFLFNVLNVISSMGAESDNTKICDVCDQIASMLRYSTSTLDRDSTIGQEIEHAEYYLKLQKLRYEHKLEYSFEVSDRIVQSQIPKIILQPLIENSIEYGFEGTPGVLEITVRGDLDSKGGWFLEIEDNGPGMEEDKLKSILKDIREIRGRISLKDELVELNLGGLGIVNTYLRLYLYFRDLLDFSIENRASGGIHIRISIRSAEQ